MIKADIISGFLGAGKTTFIKTLIEKAYTGEKIVLIENEFGEIGIDSRFMQHAGIQVTEMNSGCICCTLVGDFEKALEQVAAEFAPDRIIIEPSGVGKLSDVIKAVETVDGVEINGKITIVDGKKAKMHIKNFGEFFNDQLEHAATIVISRSQMMEEDKLKDCVHALKEYNGSAAIITTPWQQLTTEALCRAVEPHEHQDCHCGHEHDHNHECCGHDHHHEDCGCDHNQDCSCGHEHHHHADEVFDSWGIETVHKFGRNELEDILKLLSMTRELGTVLRAKGIVEGVEGQWMEFDMVPEELEIRDCTPDYTGRICVIGTDLKTEDLNQVFGN